MYKLILGKGFELTFQNGYRLVIDWGAGVGDHKDIVADLPMSHLSVSETGNGDCIKNSVAEVTVYKDKEVVGYHREVSPDDLVYIIGQAAIRETGREFLEVSL